MENEVLAPTVDLDTFARIAAKAAMASRVECERIERQHVEDDDFVAWLNWLASS